MPRHDRTAARGPGLALRMAAAIRAGTRRPKRRKPDDPGSAAAPMSPDPSPRPLVGGAAAEID